MMEKPPQEAQTTSPEMKKKKSTRLTKAALAGAVVASTGLAYEAGRQSSESHALNKIPENIESTSHILMPGLDLQTRGLSVAIRVNKNILNVPSGRKLELAIDQAGNERPSIGIEGNEISSGSFAHFSHEGDHAILATEPTWSNKFTKNGNVFSWTTDMSASIEKDDKQLEEKRFSIKQEALGVVDSKNEHPFMILADQPRQGNKEVMIKNLKDASEIIIDANKCISSFEVSKHVGAKRHFIERVLLYQPTRSDDTRHNYAATIELGRIRGNNEELEMRTLLLSGILHESSHFIAAAVDDENAKKIERAFTTFLKLGGDAPGKWSGVDPEQNSVYNTLDESSVFGLNKQTGHPFANSSELFASLIACITYAPDKVEELIGKLPLEKQKRMRDEVIRPCLNVLGDQWGSKLVGDAYRKF